MGLYTDHFDDGAELKRLREENFELTQRLQNSTRAYSELKREINAKLRVKSVLLPREGITDRLEITQVIHTPDGVEIEVTL